MATTALVGWPREYTAAALLLVKAADFAAAEGRSPWDFAVVLEDLHRAGLTKADLRRLICRGWVEQAEELVGSGVSERVFRPVGLLTIGRHSCFVLTAQGRAAIRHGTSTIAPPVDGGVPPVPRPRDAATGERSSNGDTQRASETGNAAAVGAAGNGHAVPGNGKLNGNGHDASGNGHAPGEPVHLKPVWDADLNRLTLGDTVVKEYRTPAPNQQCILAVFQKEGWPVRIDDPLPPHGEQDPKRRLHETIVSLNRNQRNRMLRFNGDGKGQGIRWSAEVRAH